nr:MAG TPA: hypothetical protein [Caudoviricetes sp.]
MLTRRYWSMITCKPSSSHVMLCLTSTELCRYAW